MQAIEIQNLSTHYDQTQVLFDINLTVPKGICFGLIGLNGAGKTTLIKVLLGLREATSGDAKLLGHVPGDKIIKSQIAYLPEKFEPPFFMTGIEFIEFTQKIYGRSIEAEAIYRMAELLQLQQEALPRRVTSYSKGMRQKLGLMATLLTDCPLIILDEPMSGLDPRARMLVKQAIDAYQKRGHTIVICSHILADLDEMCPQVAIIHEGYLKFNGSPANLRSEMKQPTLERAFLDCIDAKRVA